MPIDNIGDKLNEIVTAARGALFRQGELTNLTYVAFDTTAAVLQRDDRPTWDFDIPVGWRPDRTPITSRKSYEREALIEQLRHLAFNQLSINSLFQLSAIVEAMLSDIVRTLIMKYPKKLGGKRSMPLQSVIEATSIEEIHLRAADNLLNELAYKSPTDFAEELKGFMPINLMECPSFHNYVEIKASRDIFIHNRGVANETYIRKAGIRSRVTAGHALPADLLYFFESYEACLALTEWLEAQRHEHWHCARFEARQSPPAPDVQVEIPMPSQATGEMSNAVASAVPSSEAAALEPGMPESTSAKRRRRRRRASVGSLQQ